MIPAVLSGGSGTRLWPVSRSKFPKQFCDLFGESLLTKTLRRLKPLGAPWTITTQDMSVLTNRCYQDLGVNAENVIFEPYGKNTAPAIGIFCRLLELKGLSGQVAGIFPADHFIEKESEYIEALRLAEEVAMKGHVVTIGIRPSYAATGYGYIETEPQALGSRGNLSALKAKGFREKPNKQTADEFLKKGGFFWNAGMFVFKVDTMVGHFKAHLPKMWETISTLKADMSNLKDIYAQVENVSVDYGIMEKLGSHVCIPCDVGWSDVGSWDEVSKIKPSDTEIVEVQSSGNFVISQDKKTYAFIDTKDLMVVETSDAVLVLPKGSSQKVKEVVDALKLKSKTSNQARVLLEERNFEVRPWGGFEVLRDTSDFKSKILHVYPGHQLSYQSHAKRAEHWVIIKGNPEVILNDKVISLKAGESIYIPLGAKHRMRNPTNETVEFVEVQVGSYFGEDDITRYQDDYKRT
jgi:mannose-1-phosphate guanylyltransferase/mannose-1-phosphate guanylyltransferase/mannose-6-phosphate isomerase